MVWNTWFVTGADSPVGIQMVRKALAKGHRVVATAEDPTAVMHSIGRVSEECLLALALDEVDAGDVAIAFRKAVECFGGIDVLVHGAAAYRPKGVFAPLSQRQHRSSSVHSLFNVTRAAIQAMRSQRTGRIHHLLSVPDSGCKPMPFSIVGFCKAVAMDVAPFGIEVSAITVPDVLRLLGGTPHHEPNQLQGGSQRAFSGSLRTECCT